MPHRVVSTLRRTALVTTLAFASSAALSAQSRIVLPAGSVIIVRTTSPLESATARNGETFETTVEQNVSVDENSIIPAGSKIRGVVSLARAATRQQSGVIEVVFDRITFSDGSSAAITGKLTSTDSAERRQIDADPNAHVVLVGGRGGIGAAIAGAGSSKGTNNILSALGSLLSQGQDVSVPAGTPLAVELDRAITLRGRGRMTAADGSTIYTGAERIRAAQQALSRLNYYRGSATGIPDDATRRALFQFQVDRGLTGTGNLDARTSQALGINVAADGAGASLSSEAASMLRRDAQALVSRLRTDVGISSSGRLSASNTYAQGDIDLWFAQSAFADNAALYEQVVRNGGNANASALAGRTLVDAARRVDAIMQNARTTTQVQSLWSGIRRQLSTIDRQQ